MDEPSTLARRTKKVFHSRHLFTLFIYFLLVHLFTFLLAFYIGLFIYFLILSEEGDKWMKLMVLVQAHLKRNTIIWGFFFFFFFIVKLNIWVPYDLD